MSDLATLGGMIDKGYRIWGHCLQAECLHSALIDLPAVAAVQGRDLPVWGADSPFRRRLICTVCRSRNVTLRMLAPSH